jgi:uncharacterized membrane protein YbaN (DUF454 family)
MTGVVAVRKPRSRLLRGIFLILGILCVGLAYVSWLPGIPTFDFVVLAAFFFARSSDRFHDWLMRHKVFGRVIRGYQGDGLTPRIKLVASAAVVASLGFSAVVLVHDRSIRTILAAVGVFAIWFIWTRKAKTETPVISSH